MVQILMTLLGLGGNLWKRRQDLKAKELEAETQIKIQRMQDAKNWEAVVASRSSRFLRWTIAAHLFVGLDFTIYLAITGAPDPSIIFTAFKLVPDWYVGLLTTMCAWAYASQPMKDAGAALVSRWRSFKGPKSAQAKARVAKPIKEAYKFSDTNS